MAWSSLAANQMVSEVEAATGGFTLIGTNPMTTKCLTKAAALAMYDLDAAAMSSYDNNQLVPKSAFVGVAPIAKYALAGIYYGQMQVSSDGGTTWVDSNAGSEGWTGCAISENGQYQFGCEENGTIQGSSNYGATWGDMLNNGYAWRAISCSRSGQYVVAVATNQYVYTSNDYGATWTAKTTSPQISWHSVFTTGLRTIATSIAGNVSYLSNDFGATWTQELSGSNARGSWIAEGVNTMTIAIAGSSYLQNSPDMGATWFPWTNAGQKNWYSISASNDSQHLAALDYNGYLYVSNGGFAIAYTPITAAGTKQWWSCTVDGTGQYMIATILGSNYVWTSNNYGATWVEHTELPLADFRCCAN